MNNKTGSSEFFDYVEDALFYDEMIDSIDQSILHHRQVDFKPQESTEFGYQSASGVVSSNSLNSKLTIKLSDSRGFLDFQNSYIQGEILIGASSSANADLSCYLDNGGIISFIKTLILKCGNREIHRIENFNKLYNIWNLYTNSPEDRDYLLGGTGDSYNSEYENVEKDYSPVTFVRATALYTSASKTLDLGTGAALTELKVGDLLEIAVCADITVATFNEVGVESALAQSQSIVNVCRVASITDDDTVVLENGILCNDAGDADDVKYDPELSDQNILAGGIKSIYRIGRVQNATRKAFVRYGSNQTALLTAPNATTKDKFAFKLPFGVFNFSKYFPLPFLPNDLELQLEFCAPHLGLVKPLDVAYDASSKLGYMITEPVFMARLVEPSYDVFAQIDNKFKTKGLSYRYINYRAFEPTLASGQQRFNVSFKTALKSIQHVLCVMTNQSTSNSPVISQAGFEEMCQSTFNRNSCKEYQFKVGGVNYPAYGPVDCDFQYTVESMNQLKQIFGDIHCSVPYWQFRDSTSDKFLICMNFSKKSFSYNSGPDCSNSFVRLSLELNSNLASAQTLHSFIAYDALMVIRPNQSVIIYE